MLFKDYKIYAHKKGFPVKVTIDYDNSTIELESYKVPFYYKGNLSVYTNFSGNMQDFVNSLDF